MSSAVSKNMANTRPSLAKVYESVRTDTPSMMFKIVKDASQHLIKNYVRDIFPG